MALVDFYQLVLLYKLNHGDVGIPSNPSYPHPMPASTPPGPPSASIKNPQPRAPISVHAGYQSRISKDNLSGATRPLVRTSTPLALGSSVCQKQEPDTNCAGKHNSEDYRRFIEQDFRRHRVFISIEDFMERVLHIPADWRTQWGPTIRGIKADPLFEYCHGSYSNQCMTTGCKEAEFYQLLVNMMNEILRLACTSTLESVRPKTPQRYVVNDPKKVLFGVLDEASLSPDIVAVHENLISYPQKGEDGRTDPKKNELGKPELSRGEIEKPNHEKDNGEKPSFEKGEVGKPSPETDETEKPLPTAEDIEKPRLDKESNLTWAQPLQVLEVKPLDCALVDGSCMPRLRRNSKPPEIPADVLRLIGDQRTRPAG